jgi:adenosine deaminase
MKPMQAGDNFHKWTKVDLHRHLEGSLRLSSLEELARELALFDGKSPEGFRSTVTVREGDPFQPQYFLSRFETIRRFFTDRDTIERFASEVIEDAAADNVCYLELRFTPAALASQGGFSFEEVSEWVVAAATAAAESRDVQVRFLLSINRHEPITVAEEVGEIALALRTRGVVGLDLAGNELNYPSEPFAGVMGRVRREGLGISVHAGEWGSVDELGMAIRGLGATRIGHGVRILEDEELLREARDAGVCFEISLTSNQRTGAIPDLHAHPLPGMLEAGLQVALTTDDPAIFGVTLSDEYRLARETLNLSPETLKGMTLSAVQASFLEPKGKRQLESQFVREFWGEEGEP